MLIAKPCPAALLVLGGCPELLLPPHGLWQGDQHTENPPRSSQEDSLMLHLGKHTFTKEYLLDLHWDVWADGQMHTVICLLLKSLHSKVSYGKKHIELFHRTEEYLFYCSDKLCFEDNGISTRNGRTKSCAGFTGHQLRLWQSRRYFQKHREAAFSLALGGKVLRLLPLVRRLILVGFHPVKTFYCICAITRNKISKKHFRMYFFFSDLSVLGFNS